MYMWNVQCSKVVIRRNMFACLHVQTAVDTLLMMITSSIHDLTYAVVVKYVKVQYNYTRGGHSYTCCTDTCDWRFDPVPLRIP